MTAVNRILVVGAGAMGSQIALLCARAGYDVACYDVSDVAIGRAQQELSTRSERDLQKERVIASDEEAAWSRLEPWRDQGD